MGVSERWSTTGTRRVGVSGPHKQRMSELRNYDHPKHRVPSSAYTQCDGSWCIGVQGLEKHPLVREDLTEKRDLRQGRHHQRPTPH